MNISKSIFTGCLKKKHKSQEALYHLVYPDLNRLVLRYVINQDDAQEIINMALYKVFVKINDFEGTHQNLGGWIKRITVNESIDWIRRKKTFLKKHDTVDYIDELLGDINELENDPEYILKLLEAIPTTTRTVFNLFIIEGYSHKEIAIMLNITEGNSKWHLHSARKQLKGWLIEKKLL